MLREGVPQMVESWFGPCHSLGLRSLRGFSGTGAQPWCRGAAKQLPRPRCPGVTRGNRARGYKSGVCRVLWDQELRAAALQSYSFVLITLSTERGSLTLLFPFSDSYQCVISALLPASQ